MLLACSRCLHRQAADGLCGKCGADAIFDLRSRRARELFEGNEGRAREKLDNRIRAVSAVVAGVAMIALYVGLRMMDRIPKGPLVWAVVGGAGFGVTAVLEKLLGHGRPSILAGLPPADLP